MDSVGNDKKLGRTEGTRRKGTQPTQWMYEVTSSTGRTLAELKERESTGQDDSEKNHA